ncbi:5-(carboxyamino)imidazole ribonucleotide synthase [Oscillochloris sp. ZM17-4]|uniref:5-(carboxyamino)imidazole ribonucleotide synthase n=1 Tax=Oscillochloris sp. ZM17-4 TaxID=2866714 RepID=UPI001C734A3F|nr:5-(carboxyamino)imidazole ribonucleotide synthase [Oscillochloris sp. ZM17-4]MBX0326832.1 5-(carboxyamino)imidazole ribonucleotide synthase [Oscillochloris sp. ZM17-4]
MTRLGIFGGGQLAQMLTQAAVSLGVETVIFERGADSPAGRLTQAEIVGAWDDPALLDTFAGRCDLVTLENEFIDAAILAGLEARGLPVFPGGATLALVQDKLLQKERIAAAGIPVPAFCGVAAPEDLRAAAGDMGWPLLLKARRNGYDGYGNATLRGPEDVAPAWGRLTRGGSPLLVEAFVPFVRELAVMVVRGRDGEARAYPVVETVQREHICHIVRAPAPISAAEADAATALAIAAVEAVAGVGIFGVELFALADGRILFNELAPRPHNSGHYTIEACVASQFENHLRAVLGWPLAPTELRAPAAVMVNLLGRRAGPVGPNALRAALAVPGAHIHLYGKRESRVGRKMGHVTALGATLSEAEDLALRAADLVDI